MGVCDDIHFGWGRLLMAIGARGFHLVVRVGRDHVALALIVLTLVAVGATLGIQQRAAVGLEGALDKEWRGTYDLLVRPADQDLGERSTGGFVEGNFVTFGAGNGITLSALDAIRAMPGVDVAAPIGLVGQIGFDRAAPVLDIPDQLGGPSVLSKSPELYRLTYELELTDASGTRTVMREVTHTALRRQSADPAELVQASDSNAAASSSPDVGTAYTGPVLPAFRSTVIAVDPDAEQRLLGPSGTFVAPLTGAPDARDARHLATEHKWLGGVDDAYAGALMQLQAAAGGEAPSRPVVPLIVNTTPRADLGLRLTVERSPEPLSAMPSTVPEVKKVATDATFVPVGTSTLELTDLLVPFATGNLELGWPGHEVFGEDQRFTMIQTGIQPIIAGRPAYVAADAPGRREPAFSVVPEEVVAIDGSPASEASHVAGVRAYRPTRTVPSVQLDTPLLLPIASFSLTNLDFGREGINYVPFGAYDPALTTLVADASGRQVDPRRVVANPSGRDFIADLPGAITDLAGAYVLRGDAPIDAIRIRVSGVSGYGDDSQRRIESVAQDIAGLGLSVTIVAGASPQGVRILVPDYDVTRAAGSDAGSLGWVSQDWTTLGAAVTVDQALSTLGELLSVIGLTVVAAGCVACAMARRRGRDARAEVLLRAGWSARRTAWWLASTDVIVAVILAAASVVLMIFSASAWMAVSTAALILASACVVLVATRERGVHRTSTRRRTATTPTADVTTWRMGVRYVRSNPAVIWSRSISWASLSVGVVAILGAAVQARTRAGGTRLAGFVLDSTFVYTQLLGVVIAMSGLAFVVVARRMETSGQVVTGRLLDSLGWSRSDIMRRSLGVAALTAAPAAVVGLLVIILIAKATSMSTTLSVVILTACLTACVALVVLSDGMRRRHA